MSNSGLELDGVGYAYGDRMVLEDVDLTVESGEFLGILGPNGSGKSTLLAVALGLVHPATGSARLFGTPATDFADGSRVGYVAQNAGPDEHNVPATVRELVRTGRVVHAGFGRFGADDRRAIDTAMARVGITDLETRRFDELSGGQRQRTLLARALAADADLLVLDEPTVGVDADARSAFYDLLNELVTEGRTILLVEHDVGTVTRHCTQVVCLNRRIHYHGSPDDLLDSTGVADAYGSNHAILTHDH